ncbi:MAG: polysaccharide deacetylase family protein [Tissierellia bacterium]|nr:polysaccharide deacetylase family protein [Tissierellia bacterium]
MDKDKRREERLRRIRRRKAIQKKKRRRLLAFILLILIVYFGIRGAIKLFTRNTFSLKGASEVQWYIDQRRREERGEGDRTDVKYRGENDIVHIVKDKMTGFDSSLVKGSNHIRRAKGYAYDTKFVREVITGEKPYTGEKIAFLTFDDGPNQTITPQILDTLKKNKVHGTFFVVGKSLTEKNKDVLQRELMEGHSIAMHSVTHDYKKMYPGRVGNTNRIGYEAQETQRLLQELLGKDFKSGVWRYPGGHMSWQGLEDGPDQAVKDAGAEWIDWNCLTGDAEPKRVRPTTVEGVVAFLDKSLKAANHPEMAVVLMHDAESKQLTADSLDSIIKYFRDEGYKFGILK